MFTVSIHVIPHNSCGLLKLSLCTVNVMIKSTLQFDDVCKNGPGLLLSFFAQFKGQICGQESRMGEGLH